MEDELTRALVESLQLLSVDELILLANQQLDDMIEILNNDL